MEGNHLTDATHDKVIFDSGTMEVTSGKREGYWELTYATQHKGVIVRITTYHDKKMVRNRIKDAYMYWFLQSAVNTQTV